MQITVDSLPAFCGVEELDNIAALSYPGPAVPLNCVVNPLGPTPARAWICMQRQHVNAINLNGTHKIVLKDDAGNQAVATGMIVSSEPFNLTPGKLNDPAAVFLVEFSDARHLLADPFLGIAISKAYNVIAPAYLLATPDANYYADTLNSGSHWTWSTMVGDLWSLCAVLGTYPGLPFSPNDIPRGFRFPGVSAWDALCRVLYRIGCAVVWVPSTGTYAIVQVGAADAGAARVLASSEGRKIFDREYLGIAAGRIPNKVRVFSHSTYQYYGTERTITTAAGQQWSTVAVTSTDENSGAAGVNANTVAGVWDDLPAQLNIAAVLQNGTALGTRAVERAADFVRMANIRRLHKIYTGILSQISSPGPEIKGAAWRQDLQGIGDPQERGGLITEIISHPFYTTRVDPKTGAFEGERPQFNFSENQPPDFAPTYPNYPVLEQIVNVTGAPDANGYQDATITQFDPTTPQILLKEAVWAWQV